MSILLRPALILFVLLSLLTGVVYPLLVTAASNALFPAQAAGSLIERNGEVVGSRLIGQAFSGPAYFWSRPSATGPMTNNAVLSSGSNYGPSNAALVDAVQSRIATVRAAHPQQGGAVPADLVTASASGIDPHISPHAARYQSARVASSRGIAEAEVLRLVDAHTQGPDWGLFGDARVNVLALNLALDALAPAAH